jgi:signal transduction histidine kinase
MSSKTAKRPIRSAAWRISLWATLAFACGNLMAFALLDRFFSEDIRRRNDAWLSGELDTLGDVAERMPRDALYSHVVGEVAELASNEVPNKSEGETESGDAVFFLQEEADGSLGVWVGSGIGQVTLQAIRSTHVSQEHLKDVRVQGFTVPFRVASVGIKDGSHLYLGLSERDELRVLRNLRFMFIVIWLLLVLLGFVVVFATTRRMLSHVRRITDSASRIGHSDVTERVPTTDRNDEVSQLALTLNGMLDRIESSVHQLHTITGSLAHDLQSPLTAIRGRLEMSLSSTGEHTESIVLAIEELDQLTDFLNMSLDVAEAKADALRLSRTEIDLTELMRAMIDLYEPSMSDKGIKVELHNDSPVRVEADAALIHRMVANLLDNELKHLPGPSVVAVTISVLEGHAIIRMEDNGPGFDSDVLERLFEGRVKGSASSGHGLGMAFVDAVARAHGGSVTAGNRVSGGAWISVALPLKAT